MFGLMSKKKYQEDTEMLQSIINSLTARITNLESSMKKLSGSTFKRTRSDQTEVKPKLTVKDKKQVQAQPENLTSLFARLSVLETVIPDVKFWTEDNNIKAQFNGQPTVVRVRQCRMNNKSNGWGFTNVKEGEVIVLLNGDGVYGVAVIRKDWISSKNSVWVAKGTARAISIGVNTVRVMRNFN